MYNHCINDMVNAMKGTMHEEQIHFGLQLLTAGSQLVLHFLNCIREANTRLSICRSRNKEKIEEPYVLNS